MKITDIIWMGYGTLFAIVFHNLPSLYPLHFVEMFLLLASTDTVWEVKIWSFHQHLVKCGCCSSESQMAAVASRYFVSFLLAFNPRHACLRCSHAVHIKFMNSCKYTHNQSESMNQNDQCAHMFS